MQNMCQQGNFKCMTDVFHHAKSIVSKLQREGHIAYFAGGWVRDFVMGHPSEDIDIATDATPAQIMDLFPQTILVGLNFGVVIVVLGGEQFEVATFRKDLHYIDGRHPTGIEKSTPLEDAKRRDFTINGMFYDPVTEEIYDFVQGKEDIQKGIIRTIGDPHERFFEDRLRMLRAFRFAARFSFTIEPETQEAIREHVDTFFPAVAMERVWQEFTKMASYPRFDQALVEMHRLGLLDVIMPEIDGMHINDIKHRVASFSHFLKNTPPVLYVMELIYPLTLEQKINAGLRLKVSVKDLKLVEFMHKWQNAVLDGISRENYWNLAHLFAHSDYAYILPILAARYAPEDMQTFLQRYQEVFNRLEKHIKRIQEHNPVVTSSMLKERGILPGRQMGLLLKEAEKIALCHDTEESEFVLSELKRLPLWP